MTESKNYEYDGKKLTVKIGSFKLVAEGEWLRFYIKQPRFGWVQSFGIDSNGATNFFDLVKNFIVASSEVAKKQEKSSKKIKK